MRLPDLRTPVATNLVIALWITLTCNQTFLSRLHEHTPFDGWRAHLFLAAAVLLLWAYVQLFLQLVTWGWLARPVLTLILLCSALTAYFVDTYGVGIDASQIQNMVQTDRHEVADLCSLDGLLNVLALCLPPLVWLWWRPTVRTGLLRGLLHKAMALGLGLAVAGGVALAFYADYASIFRNHRELRLFVNPHNYVNGLRGHFRSQHMEPLPLLPLGRDAHRPADPAGSKPRLLVLVVGETARAESFSLNGYAKDTNRELKPLPVLNFSQVSSCGTATAVSLPCLFSGFTRSDYDTDVSSHREGLLDILQRAGYQVTWLDNNSGCKGTCARVETLPLLASRKAAWCGEDDECLDDIVVDTLAEHLKRAPVQDRVVVIHQMGSHGPAYFKRYPPAYRRFTPTCDSNELQRCTPEQVRNSYDNTIAYTDHILARTIQVLQRESRYRSAFWYVSDHGESTGEKGLYLHGAPYLFAPSQQTHVPMLAWLSPGYRELLGARADCLAARRQDTLSHDNVFHTVLGLLDVQTAERKSALDLSHCSAR